MRALVDLFLTDTLVLPGRATTFGAGSVARVLKRSIADRSQAPIAIRVQAALPTTVGELVVRGLDEHLPGGVTMTGIAR